MTKVGQKSLWSLFWICSFVCPSCAPKKQGMENKLSLLGCLNQKLIWTYHISHSGEEWEANKWAYNGLIKGYFNQRTCCTLWDYPFKEGKPVVHHGADEKQSKHPLSRRSHSIIFPCSLIQERFIACIRSGCLGGLPWSNRPIKFQSESNDHVTGAGSPCFRCGPARWQLAERHHQQP